VKPAARLALIALAACHGAEPAAAEDAGVPAVPSPGCAAPLGLDAGTTHFQLAHDGVVHDSWLHVPSGHPSAPVPLVINLHGFLVDGPQQEAWSKMDALADEEGFAVAYATGTGSPASWNAGDCCAFDDKTRDDVGFVSALIDEAGRRTCVDLARVYATGMSNGGFLAHRLACELGDRVAAIAPVAGVLGVDPSTCTPARAIPVLDFHGTSDPIVPYDGGMPPGLGLLYPGLTATFRSVAATVEFWRSADGCGATSQQTFSNGDATCLTYDSCRDGAEVALCTIAGGGHTWPGGDPNAVPGTIATVLGSTSTSIDASRRIWQFFKRYALPATAERDGGPDAAP
jgi:polyhydroxybutyrate depolymerase